LLERFPLGVGIIGEQAKKDFLRCFGAILRLRNILSAFDEFAGNEILSPLDFQDYQSMYIDCRPSVDDKEKENINDDIVFELELIKQIEVNIDYILMLTEKYRESNCEDKTILTAISKAINSSIELRSKRQLIEEFILRVNISTRVDSDWEAFVQECREKELASLILSEKLKEEETLRFMEMSFRDGVLRTTGTDIDRLLPPLSRFGGGNRAQRKQEIIDKLLEFFDRYYGLGS